MWSEWEIYSCKTKKWQRLWYPGGLQWAKNKVTSNSSKKSDLAEDLNCANVTRSLTFFDKNLEIEKIDNDDLQLMEARDNRAQNNENKIEFFEDLGF